jgi:hypothetical protein
LLILVRLRTPGWSAYHWLRLLGLAAILFVLLAGGLVVSVKIGGGSNLHNLDAYLALLAVIGGAIGLGRFVPEGAGHPAVLPPAALPSARQGEKHKWVLLPQIAILLSLIVMAFFTVASSGPSEVLPSNTDIEKALAYLERHVALAVEDGGHVLFLSDRHLLTFNYLTGVPLVPDYERVFLMEMAMAGDPAYLDAFHEKLARHEFALIISEPLYSQEKGGESMFGEENDAWVRQVSDYILCYYKSAKIFRPVHIQIFIPDPAASHCP